MVVETSSFRDPAGRVVCKNGVYFREIAQSYYHNYRLLMESGLYDDLTDEGLLVQHQEITPGTLFPEQLSFISYPEEWCFSQLKKAALATLDINRIALNHGMILKDASAYNIQWHNGKPRLIDTLSFIEYQDGQPWWAYRQFLMHFVAPLLLFKYRKTWIRDGVEGTDLNIIGQVLPFRAKLKPMVFLNFGLPRILNKLNIPTKDQTISKRNLSLLLLNMYGLVASLNYKPSSDWSHYHSESYSQKAQEDKYIILAKMLNDFKESTVWDIGANTGVFSHMAAIEGHEVIATDRDHDCVEKLFSDNGSVLPLMVDFCQPTPAIGWGNTERASFLDRIQPDIILALAVIHHICIDNNVPLYKVAELLASKCKLLIIEWVPPDDPKAIEIAGKKVYPAYNHDLFLSEFGKYFSWWSLPIKDSQREIYCMERK